MSDLLRRPTEGQTPARRFSTPEVLRWIGANARRLREEQRRTVDDVADMCDLHPAEYVRLEAGEEPHVDLALLGRLCAALETDVVSLLAPPTQGAA